MQIRPVPEVSLNPRPRARSGRRLWFALAMLLLSLGAGYTGWWLYAASQLRDATLAWIADRRAEGWRLEHGDVTRRGFPMTIGLQFDKAAVGVPGRAWAWSASRVLLSTPVLGTSSLQLRIEGDQTIEFADSSSGRSGQRYFGKADQFAFDLAPGGWVPNGHLAVRDLAFAGEDSGGSFALARLDLVSRGDPAAADPSVSTYALELTAADLRMPEGAAIPLCPHVKDLALDAKLLGRLDPEPWPASLARWRDDGGAVEARRLSLACGPLAVEGEGTFALDPAGQPIGAMTARIEGYEAALDELTKDGVIPPHTAATTKILLRALARTRGEGVPVLIAPVSIQDRTVSVGPVPLLRFNPVGWLNEGGKTP